MCGALLSFCMPALSKCCGASRVDALTAMSCSHQGEMLGPHGGKIKDYEGHTEQAQREKAREKRSEKLRKANDNEANDNEVPSKFLNENDTVTKALLRLY